MEEPTVTSLQGQEAREQKLPKQEGAEPIAVTANTPNNKKRKPDNGGFHDSEFVKVRALVKELRPFFMEVLHTQDFRISKAAYEIKKRMKSMTELTKQLTEATSALKPSIIVPEQPLPGAVLEEKEERKVEIKRETTPPPQPSGTLVESSNSGIVTKQKVESKVLEKSRTEVSRGTFVVGGSPIGWNFLLYPGTKLVYYGRTKESVLASRASK